MAQQISSRLVLLSTGLSMFAVFLDTSILYVAFPSIGASFPSASPADLSWVLNAYTIVFAAALIPAGRIADRIGRRKTFLGAVWLFTIASMLCGLAPNVWVLVASRVLQAIGAAAMVPSSLALVLQSHTREEVPRAIAIWGAVGAVAGAAGPTLGSLIVDLLDWRWAFYVNLPVGIVSYLLGRRVLPEGREVTRGGVPDPISALLVVAGLSLVAYGIVTTESHGWTSVAALGPMGGGVLLLALFVWRSARVRNPVLDLRLFRSPGFRWASLGMVIFSVGFAALFLGNILFMTGIWNYSIIQAGFAIALGPAIVSVLAPRFGQLASRIGQRAILIPGGLVWASGGVLLLVSASERPAYLTVYLPAVVITAIGVSMILPQLNSAAVQDLPPDQLGQGSAVSQAARNLGTTIGVALTIAILAADPGLHGFHSTWWILISSGLIVTSLALLLPRRESAVPQPARELSPGGR